MRKVVLEAPQFSYSNSPLVKRSLIFNLLCLNTALLSCASEIKTATSTTLVSNQTEFESTSSETSVDISTETGSTLDATDTTSNSSESTTELATTGLSETGEVMIPTPLIETNKGEPMKIFSSGFLLYGTCEKTITQKMWFKIDEGEWQEMSTYIQGEPQWSNSFFLEVDGLMHEFCVSATDMAMNRSLSDCIVVQRLA